MVHGRCASGFRKHPGVETFDRVGRKACGIGNSFRIKVVYIRSPLFAIPDFGEGQKPTVGPVQALAPDRQKPVPEIGVVINPAYLVGIGHKESAEHQPWIVDHPDGGIGNDPGSGTEDENECKHVQFAAHGHPV